MCSLFQNHSLVLAECGQLVCAGILCGHIGLNKKKTNHRSRLGISTLNSLLTVQFNVPQKCYEYTFLMKLLFGFFLLPKNLDNTGE